MKAKTIERKIKTDYDKNQLLTFLSQKSAPFTVAIKDWVEVRRSIDQNRMQRKWLQEAEAQGDMTAEEYRAYCKLHFGVPILRAENEHFRELYDEKVKPFSYEMKLQFMAEPWDFPVTRLMTKGQKSKYLSDIRNHFISMGFILTETEGLF